MSRAHAAKGFMRIAIVIPWFGPDLKGGAEQQAWQLASRMAGRGHRVDALTTCCRSFLDDWTVNHHAVGSEMVEGVRVRRFPVDARDRAAFDGLNGQLLAIPREGLRPGISPVSRDRAKIWTDQNINSRALENYISESVDDYDAFVFLPYLYGPTLRGLPLVAKKAWMQPCLHDEAYAYLPDVADAVYASRGLLFLSTGEQQVAARLFGPCVWSKGIVAGAGIEFESLELFKEQSLPAEVAGSPYLLCLGRREAGKGVDHLVSAYRQWRRRRPAAPLRLVLAGPGSGSYHHPEDGILDLGLVSDATRVALLWNCIALANPSPNESFSRVLFEAWYCGRPALVRRNCLATSTAVEQSTGGWTAESEAQWADSIAAIATRDPEVLSDTGRAGRAYAVLKADWNHILEECENFIRDGGTRGALSPREVDDLEAIHQLTPNFGFGDAISNELIAVRTMLRSAGYRSDIMASAVDPRLLDEAKIFAPGLLRQTDAVIYHHSIGAPITEAAIEHAGPKALVYHNITPAEFFRPYRPEFARILRDGREDLWSLAANFNVSVGDSRFNADELGRYGFDRPGVMPLPLDPGVWNASPNPKWMARLGDGRKNVLFAGRVAPNKRQDRLVRAFSILRSMADVRLIIAGSAAPGDPFADEVRALVGEFGLEQDVVFSGHCPNEDMHAFFRSAHAFWSFSEHEGFCVPLIEAMWFDIPIVALSSSAVPETLGGAGLTFSWTDEDFEIAASVRRVLSDEALRAEMLARQRSRRWAFHVDKVAPCLAQIVDRLRTEDALKGEPAHG